MLTDERTAPYLPGAPYRRGEFVVVQRERVDWIDHKTSKRTRFELWELTNLSRDGMTIRKGREWFTTNLRPDPGYRTQDRPVSDFTRVAGRVLQTLRLGGPVDRDGLAERFSTLVWDEWHSITYADNAAGMAELLRPFVGDPS